VFDGAVGDLISLLGKLPGIGPKSAQRIAFYILQNPNYDPHELATLLSTIRELVRSCSICGMLTSEEVCAICSDASRPEDVLCVVEETKDVWAIERTGEYRGKYHVLGGSLSPIDGLGPDQLRIRELVTRLSDGSVTEVILATDPNLEGEATASYLSRLLDQPGLRVTRLASGLPVGGDLEYADEVTLGRAFSGRRQV
jgi:recombination protein RecR